MKLVRPAVALATLACLAGGVTANAATKPKPVCNLVPDASGDANGVDLGSPVPATTAGSSIPALDITSVDVASDKKTITAVVRVKQLSAKSSTAPTGMSWNAQFTVGETTFFFGAHANPTGALSYDAAYESTGTNSLYANGSVTGVFDSAKNEVRITAPISLLEQESIKLGTKITAIEGATGPEIAIPDATGLFGGGAILEGNTYISDTASGGKDYTSGALSCVKPGA